MLEYRESAGDDQAVNFVLPFRCTVKLDRGETAVFRGIVFNSRAHRGHVNAESMQLQRVVYG